MQYIMHKDTYREWRFGIFSGKTLHACQGFISWPEKRVRIIAPPCPFSLKGLYKALFTDPTHAYTLIRAFFKPMRLVRDSAERISEVECEFFHRKD
ncbi:MAG: hypothetical protein A2268_11530 [Candidatus Raymondbacteria bacterium RifOxyA12_full_50_37]|uniref:Uncharacterized protein n=1 Tax=Candidatus Raymondbacteria bacterium RIFOXYD12_FULL_49_13 TaxID=1817890 RepID=A0A1F7FAQ5_UNCRA|nr:MAG: hypothetical protein A2268_11530 [Candidatus Raymondbacteria bacterium RifOxyA12_full_50_37]OGJ86352.1 MAG: hypothetical protein A2350_03890 [Candidatus Raymondbacteria bacterium RifOxyB12_full_50_8]OGJ92399.1 MAG: hypothetical protein A2248_10655 [Candidatus Raymondbacteria bacterium RIFOXYA2_FULL_49_16]OGJ99380.1 MAG: hypothetical protein A2453_13715 [Candidatus Raymondbacteria bacterium RIFOXYC2_FULL_50_21]OGK03082.1 MAG: hypothetical protein A2487_04010 [Candidatus Raymondbacteria b